MGTAPHELFEQLQHAVDAVADLDLDGLGPVALAEVIETMEAQRRRLDCTQHRVLARFDKIGAPRDLGYRTTNQYQRDRLCLPPGAASRRTRVARALRVMPTVAKHWIEGTIGDDAVALIASARTPDTADAFDVAEPLFAQWATELDYPMLRTAVNVWRSRARAEDESEPAPVERRVFVSPLMDGAVAIDGVLDPVGGAIFCTEFERIVNVFFKADWAEAKARLGREPVAEELCRTPAQRRSDAVVEMATRSAAAHVTEANRPRPLLTVVLSAESLAEALARHWRTGDDSPPAELWDGQPLTVAELARLLALDPDIERFVFGGPSEPIQHNPRRRLFTGKLRRAIQVRDRHCQGLGCHVSASECDVDHKVPHSEGGETTAANGRLACGPCNRARPHRRFHGDPDPP